MSVKNGISFSWNICSFTGDIFGFFWHTHVHKGKERYGGERFNSLEQI